MSRVKYVALSQMGAVVRIGPIYLESPTDSGFIDRMLDLAETFRSHTAYDTDPDAGGAVRYVLYFDDVAEADEFQSLAYRDAAAPNYRIAVE